MMRFEPSTRRRPPNYLAHPQQVRLLVLLMSFGLVIVLMCSVREPKTAQRLNRLLTNPHVASGQTGQARPTADPVEVRRDFTVVAQPELLESIEDNTYFRSEESAAWFQWLEVLQSATESDLAAASTAEVDYVQLVEQPHAFRGRPVTVRGTVRRVESLRPAENDIGLDQYYLITLRPVSGQIWPIRVYVLQLPDDFPTGGDVSTEVSVTGFFFKNWSYEWRGGLGLAPVLLAKSLTWHDEPIVSEASDGSISPSMIQVALVSAIVAAMLTGWAVWNTGTSIRKSTDAISPADEADDVAISLERLTEPASDL